MHFLRILLISAGIAQAFHIPGWNAQTYEFAEKIPLYVNKVFSDHTQLPYAFYEIGFVCKPKEKIKKLRLNLGEILRGDRISASDFDIVMKKDINCNILCTKHLTQQEILRARSLISDNYYAEWLIDGLPSASVTLSSDESKSHYHPGFPLGKVEDGNIYLNNHYKIVLKYKSSDLHPDLFEIIGFEIYPHSINDPTGKCLGGSKDLNKLKPLILPDIDLKEQKKKNKSGKEINFPVSYSYSVSWVYDDSTEWSSRWDKYLIQDESKNVHWLSLLHSIIIAFFLTVIVGIIIIRTLYNDIEHYNFMKDSDIDIEINKNNNPNNHKDEITGWKLLHSDVFRPPKNATLLTILVGNGAQLLTMTLIILIFASIGLFKPSYRGGLISYSLFFFAFSGIVAGYISAILNKAFSLDQNWLKNSIRTGTVLPSIILLIVVLLNFFVWGASSSSALPFGTVVSLLAMWFFINLPLVILGGYIGNKRDAIKFPSQASVIPRQIPKQPFFLRTIPSLLISGLISFAVIFIELIFVMKSVWNYNTGYYYYVYGFLGGIFLIMIIVVIEVSITGIYFQLCAENHRWWWNAFIYGAGSAIWIFFYLIWYFIFKLDINNFVTIVLYFGYSILCCLVYGIIIGSISFLSAFVFVRRIYSATKTD